MAYIRVILPLALPWEPVYSTEAAVQVGDRIRVSLSGRSYMGVVSATDVKPDIDPSRIQPAGPVQTGLEAVSEREIRFWETLAEYYLCTVGEVYKTAYPALKTDSEETAARVRERMEQRLERLRADLAKKHRDPRVIERIEAQIGDLERALHPSEEAPAAPPEIALSASERMIAEAVRDASGTVLLQCESSRTEVFLHLAAETLRCGRSVLWLVPEIALTSALERTVAACFPTLLTYHSGLTAARRRDVAEALRGPVPRLVLATRSALLLPFRDLGMILIDQEHDPSYKQDAPAPRYGTREAAIFLAGIHGARVVLGSATPSLESCYNARSGRYRLIRPEEKPRERQVELIDIPAEKRKKGIYGILSRRLADNIRTASKVLLICPTHSSYCTPESVKAELESLYGSIPAHVQTGTQPALLAEGTDYTAFDCVALLQGDALLLGQGDFRADERAWQLLTQLLLRCRPGVRLCIQTSRGAHPLWQYFISGDSDRFYNAQLSERQIAGYPPYTRAIDILIRDTNAKRLELLSTGLVEALSQRFPSLPLEGAFMPQRPGSEDLRQIRLMLPRTAALRKQKALIAELVAAYENGRHYAGHISLDVDPQ